MANEKRLIFVDSIKHEQKNILFMGRNAGKMKSMLNDVVTLMIENCPTVDAVEVVRCKDCKHRGSDLCPMETVELYPWFGTKNDAFCSYGERREVN